MKYMSEFALRPGTQKDYKLRHDAIWPEMTALIREAGLQNYTIWNRDCRLIEYFETDDIDSARRIIAKSEVKRRWDEYMSDILVLNNKGEMTALDLVFESH